MSTTKKLMEAGGKAGKKVLSTDAAQNIVGTVVDTLEKLVVDNADDVAADVKTKAAKAGGHRVPKSTTKKTSARRKTSSRKPATRRKTTARKPATRKKTTARKKTASRKSPGRTKSTARKPATRKTSARRKTSSRKPVTRRKTSGRKR